VVKLFISYVCDDAVGTVGEPAKLVCPQHHHGRTAVNSGPKTFLILFSEP